MNKTKKLQTTESTNIVFVISIIKDKNLVIYSFNLSFHKLLHFQIVQLAICVYICKMLIEQNPVTKPLQR